MVKKEEGEHTVSKKPKRTKEEIEESRQLKIKKKEEEEQSRWRWLGSAAIFILYCSQIHLRATQLSFSIVWISIRWEEEKYEDGVKWKFLEHSGPYFPPEYQPLPDNIHFYYDGQLNVLKGRLKYGCL